MFNVIYRLPIGCFFVSAEWQLEHDFEDKEGSMINFTFHETAEQNNERKKMKERNQ